MLENLPKTRVRAFDSHKHLFTLLTWFGFWELQSTNRRLKYFHTIYRVLACVILLYFNAVELYYVTISIRYDENVQWPSVVMVINNISFVIKYMCLLWNTKKINAVNDEIKGPMFAANTRQNEQFIRENFIVGYKMLKIIFCVLDISVSWWLSFKIILAIRGKEQYDTMYYPINMDTTAGIIKAFLIQLVFRNIWMGVGHICIDILMVSYYMQAISQLRLLKFNLERLFDNDKELTRGRYFKRFQYLDECDEDVTRRFSYYFCRSYKMAWIVNNTSDIFGFGMAAHMSFLVFLICFGIYDGTEMIARRDVGVVYWMLILIFALGQSFTYCYFGSLLQSESESMNNAIYCSNWTDMSPKFRRMIVIAMSIWQRPITIKLCGLIPLSLNTFIAMCRMAYSMFTVLMSMT